MSAITVSLAGSTGSIGTQTLDVIEAEPDRFELVALGASGRRLDEVVDQAERFRPKVVAVADRDVSGVEAAHTDPQQRLFLEEAWRAI